uniref:Uncharacterized protein n=1 Tax=Arundo donax TaxID=35708 RepID=A0A0A9DWK2_ARUDO
MLEHKIIFMNLNYCTVYQYAIRYIFSNIFLAVQFNMHIVLAWFPLTLWNGSDAKYLSTVRRVSLKAKIKSGLDYFLCL